MPEDLLTALFGHVTEPPLVLFKVRLNQSLANSLCHFWMEPAALHTLAHVPFFKDVADLDFERFDRRCNWRRYKEGEIVVDYEDESSDVYFIISGEVRILIRTLAGKEIILGETKAGQFFGEMAAIDGAKRSANVTALTNSEVCIMPTNVFREVIFSSPTTCERILRLLTGRVRELNARFTEHSIFDLKHRLYSELLRMAHPRQGRPNERCGDTAAFPPCFGRADWLPARAGDARTFGHGRRRTDRKNPRRAHPFAAEGAGNAARRGYAGKRLGDDPADRIIALFMGLSQNCSDAEATCDCAHRQKNLLSMVNLISAPKNFQCLRACHNRGAPAVLSWRRRWLVNVKPARHRLSLERGWNSGACGDMNCYPRH